jgi:hypothetical protein
VVAKSKGTENRVKPRANYYGDSGYELNHRDPEFRGLLYRRSKLIPAYQRTQQVTAMTKAESITKAKALIMSQ